MKPWHKQPQSFLISLLAGAFLILAGNQTRAQSTDWGETSILSTSSQISSIPQIALSSDGTKATAIWKQFTGFNYYIQSKSASISDNITSWGDLTTPVTAPSSALVDPLIALSDDGTKTTLVWRYHDGKNWLIRSISAILAGDVATWGTETDLSLAGVDAANHRIALSSDGTIVMVIWDSNETIQSITATLDGNTPTWNSVTDLTPTGERGWHPDVSLSPDGTKAAAVWYHWNGSNQIIQSASATLVGNVTTWGAVTDLIDNGKNSYNPQISLSADGSKATAVWRGSDGSNTIIQSASATLIGSNATWSAVTDLSVAGQNASRSRVALASDGTMAMAIWDRSDGLNYIIQSSAAAISGNIASWSSVTDLSVAGQNALSPNIALSTNGENASAIWFRHDGSNNVIQSASTVLTGNTAKWDTAMDLSGTGHNAESPQIALSSDGTKATAVWKYKYNDFNSYIQSASLLLPPQDEGDFFVIPLLNDRAVIFGL